MKCLFCNYLPFYLAFLKFEFLYDLQIGCKKFLQPVSALGFAVWGTDHETRAFAYDGAFLPRHRNLPRAGTRRRCHQCLRNVPSLIFKNVCATGAAQRLRCDALGQPAKTPKTLGRFFGIWRRRYPLNCRSSLFATVHRTAKNPRKTGSSSRDRPCLFADVRLTGWG
jgi:hypothetical protein